MKAQPLPVVSRMLRNERGWWWSKRMPAAAATLANGPDGPGAAAGAWARTGRRQPAQQASSAVAVSQARAAALRAGISERLLLLVVRDPPVDRLFRIGAAGGQPEAGEDPLHGS